ncbi:hypothetical protein [Alteromonas facilis]|uniref:hypothetical protein n=1 Tax=Alteromonas facilis TaxID=2048004 RepID=UPI000C292286|nr:hypothetical protein [Alteromonas facilis]
MEFCKHGTYSIRFDSNKVFVEATGPFNLELVQDYKLKIEECISALEPCPWGQIITLNELSLFTPEAESALIFGLKLRKERGLKACAIVAKSPFRIVLQQIDKIYSEAEIKHKTFKNERDAVYWVDDEINNYKRLRHPFKYGS